MSSDPRDTNGLPDLRYIRELAKVFRQYDLDEIEIENGEQRVLLRRGDLGGGSANASAGSAPRVVRHDVEPAPAPTPAPAPEPVRVAAVEPARTTPADAIRTVAPSGRSAPAIARAAEAARATVAVAKVRPQAVAMLDRKLLSDTTFGEVVSGARREANNR